MYFGPLRKNSRWNSTMARQTFSSVSLRWPMVRMNQRASCRLCATNWRVLGSFASPLRRDISANRGLMPSTGIISSFRTITNSPSCSTTCTSGQDVAHDFAREVAPGKGVQGADEGHDLLQGGLRDAHSLLDLPQVLLLQRLEPVFDELQRPGMRARMLADLHEKALPHVLHAGADGIESLDEVDDAGDQVLVLVLQEDVQRLLVEAVLVEIADQELADAEPRPRRSAAGRAAPAGVPAGSPAWKAPPR